MNLSAFFQALYGDWISLMSGVFSVVLTILGFAPSFATRLANFISKLLNLSEAEGIRVMSRLFWGAGLVCFFLSSARIWTIEHEKVLSQTALLEHTVEFLHKKGSPFHIGEPIKLLVPWFNHGTFPAAITHPRYKILVVKVSSYMTPDIEQWKKEYREILKDKNEPESPSIYPGGQSLVHSVEGPVFTDSIAKEMFTDRNHTIIIIGALRFSDGSGLYEAHICSYLSSMDINLSETGPPAAIWSNCTEYINPIKVHD